MTIHTFTDFVLYFMIYSMIGWAVETAWCSVAARRFVNRGFLGGPWCPVYGFGAIAVLLVADPLRWSPPLVYVASVVATSALEYFTGWLMEALFKTRWWDYSNMRFQIRGRVCLRNALLFGLMGLGAVYALQPAIEAVLARVSADAQGLIASLAIVVLFVDLIRALASATRLEERLARLRDELHALGLLNQAHAWYDAADLPGSLTRLRGIVNAGQAEETELAAARAALASVDALLTSRVGARLLRAYPLAWRTRFQGAFEALRQDRERRRRERRHRDRIAWGKAMAALSREWAAAKVSYRDVTVTKLIWVFLIGSVIGFLVETVFYVVVYGELISRQAMVYGPFNQVYGFGAVAMVLVLTPFAAKNDRWLFFGGAVVGGLFEVVCGLFLEFAFGTKSWDYSNQAFSFFGGRTSLLFMLFWGILAVVYMKMIYPRMVGLIDRIPVRPRRFFSWVIAVFLALDMLLSAVAIGRWSARDAGRMPTNAVEVWIDEAFPDGRMEGIYPSMKMVK